MPWPTIDWLGEGSTAERWTNDLASNLSRHIFPKRNYDYWKEPIEPMFPSLGVLPNMILNSPEHLLKTTSKLAHDYYKPFEQDVRDLVFTPVTELNKRKAAEDQAAADKAKADLAAQGAGGGVVEADSDPTEFRVGERFVPIPPPTIEAVEYPLPPAMPNPAARPTREAFDFQPFLDRMAEYMPQDLDRGQYMKERLLANLSRAFAAGASGSGWSGGAGAFARFGSGFGMGQADTTDAFLAEQAGIDEDQRRFGMDRLSLEMQLAQEADNIAFENQQTQWQNEEDIRQTDIANNAAEYNVLVKNIAEINAANQQNADRFWEYENTIGERFETKILPGTGKGNIVLDTTDGETGERVLKYINLTDDTMGGLYDADDINKLQDIVQLKGEDAPELQQFLYAPALASGDELQVKRLMAAEALRNGGLEELGIPLDDIKVEAEKIVGQQGVSITDDDAWTKAMERAMTYKIAEVLDIRNPEVLQILASKGGFGASILLQRAAPRPGVGVAGGQ